MKLSRTTTLLIIYTIVTILLVGFTFFFFTVIRNKNIHTESVNKTLEDRIKEKKQGSSLIKVIHEAENQNKQINSYFVNANSIDYFVSDLEKNSVGLGTRAEVQSVEFSKDNKKVITIVLLVEGNFNSVVKVIKMIEYMPFAININSLNLSANTNQKDSKETFYPWSSTISFNIFTF
ncbi:MAG: hypothetical protein NTX85_00395 [Candidatus Nomurabacteria bacterium]|nr:hypothetical protein [Candidatus Nomurabacteria bacterium]